MSNRPEHDTKLLTLAFTLSTVYIQFMTTDSLQTRSFKAAAENAYGELQPICENNYSKNILSAAEMKAQGQGNCFTLAEEASLRLETSDTIAITCIALTKYARRTNTHAYCLALSADRQSVAKLDLGIGEVVYQPASTIYRRIFAAVAQPDQILYRYVYQAAPNAVMLRSRLLTDTFDWPVNTQEQRVYMSSALGLRTLHCIANAGGMSKLLDINNENANLKDLVPQIPLA